MDGFKTAKGENQGIVNHHSELRVRPREYGCLYCTVMFIHWNFDLKSSSWHSTALPYCQQDMSSHDVPGLLVTSGEVCASVSPHYLARNTRSFPGSTHAFGANRIRSFHFWEWSQTREKSRSVNHQAAIDFLAPQSLALFHPVLVSQDWEPQILLRFGKTRTLWAHQLQQF